MVRSYFPMTLTLLPFALPAQPPHPEAIEAAVRYSEELGGACVMIMHEGEITFQEYTNNVEPGTAMTVQSGTKAFWAAAAAAMIDDGLMESFDEPATRMLPEWEGVQFKEDITIRHLMELNGLHQQSVPELQGCERETHVCDKYDFAINTRAVREPGEVFSYGPVNYYAFAEIMKRKLADREQDPLDYLTERIFEPIGLEFEEWCTDDCGNPHLPNGAVLNAENWMKFGQLLLQEGEWEGEQLIPANLMRDLREPSEVNPGHGLFLWLNTPGGASYVGEQINFSSDPDWPGGFIYHFGEPDLFGAMGGGKNRMYIIPSRELVVVRQTLESGDDFIDSDFLEILLSEPSPEPAFDFSQVTAHLDANLSVYEGQVVMIVERDGERLYEYSAGGFTPDTKAGIASATKWIAGAVMLSVYDDGSFDLDDRVGDYVESMEAAGKGDFTIRHAFSMSSGLFATLPGQRYHNDPRLTLEESVQQIADNVGFIFDPGQAIAYDGLQMQVAGLAAKVAAGGTPWKTLAQECIFDPLKMEDSDYDRFDQNPGVAGGVNSTANDYMKFLNMLASGGMGPEGRVLEEESVEILLSNQTDRLPIIYTPIPEESDWFPNDDGEMHYGFGAWVFAEPPGADRPTEVCSHGAWGTFPWIDRERNIQGIIFTDVPAGGQSTEATLQAIQLVRNAIDHSEKTAVRLGNRSNPYFDPEASSEQGMITFQDGNNDIWLSRIDPKTGFFASSTHGRDILVSTEAAPLLLTNNGPEFGEDSDGWSIFFTHDGPPVYHIARATIQGSLVTLQPVTPFDHDRTNCLPSRIPTSPDTLIGYMRGTADVDGPLHYASDTPPFSETYIREWSRVDGVPVQWLPDRRALALVKTLEGEENRRLGILDAETDEFTVISDGSADVGFPAPYLAPEFGGALCIAALENKTDMIIWREEPDGNWSRIARVPIPPGSQYSQFKSPEAFSFAGRSFVSTKIEPSDSEGISAGEIWVLELSADPDRIAVRVDDGSREHLRRGDPEFFVGEDDVFVYYNLINDQLLYEAWVGRAGLEYLIQQPAPHSERWIVN